MVPDLWRLGAGGRVSFRFSGTALGFYDVLGPHGGTVQIELDDQITRQVRIPTARGRVWRRSGSRGSSQRARMP